MKRLIAFLICFVAWAATMGAVGEDSLSEVLTRLDSCLAVSKNYDAQKELRITSLRTQLQHTGSLKEQYSRSIQLYREYSSYQYDSAYVYANRSLNIARRLSNSDYELEATCAIVFCQSSAGLYKEAFDTFSTLSLGSDVQGKYREMYFETAARLNYDVADYNHTEPYYADYVNVGSIYTDSLLASLPENSAQWWSAVGRRQMKEYDYQGSKASLNNFLTLAGDDLHGKAIAQSSLGWMEWRDGNIDKAKILLAEAAICDVWASTKETTALCMLSELLYQDGDIRRATSYVQKALQSARFYSARQRQIEVGNILPIIEDSRNEVLTRQRNMFIAFTVICLLLLGVIFFLGQQARIRSRKLREANSIIEHRNNELAATNEQLQEANRIKVEYIGNSLYANAIHVDDMERLYQTVARKVAAKQYDELLNVVKGSQLNKQRNDMFATFDDTFLKIFPHFVEEYNKLFPEDEQRPSTDKELMHTEMRIFALIRLGINDSERIARFLNKSVHTINTYKTRVKNKSLVKNEDFESRIMSIDKLTPC